MRITKRASMAIGSIFAEIEMSFVLLGECLKDAGRKIDTWPVAIKLLSRISRWLDQFLLETDEH